MARSDDLAPLLIPGAGPVLGFRQGVVVAWDPVTFANQVRVGGTVLDDLPLLSSADAALIVPGDVVSILTLGPTWGILGRFVQP